MKNAIVFISASRDWTESRFMFEFMRLQQKTDWNIATCNLMGHCAADRHNEAFNMLPGLEKMWGFRCDKVLFMDTDQYYPVDYLIKMLEHGEPVVGSYSVSRYQPYEIAQYNNVGNKVVDGVTFSDYQPIKQNDITESTFYCDAIGLGAAMFGRDLIDIIQPPWFKDLIDSKGVRLLCDDFYFFSKLNAEGYRVLVDKNIMVGHYTVFLVLPINRHILLDARNKWVEYTGQG